MIGATAARIAQQSPKHQKKIIYTQADYDCWKSFCLLLVFFAGITSVIVGALRPAADIVVVGIVCLVVVFAGCFVLICRTKKKPVDPQETKELERRRGSVQRKMRPRQKSVYTKRLPLTPKTSIQVIDKRNDENDKSTTNILEQAALRFNTKKNRDEQNSMVFLNRHELMGGPLPEDFGKPQYGPGAKSQRSSRANLTHEVKRVPENSFEKDAILVALDDEEILTAEPSVELSTPPRASHTPPYYTDHDGYTQPEYESPNITTSQKNHNEEITRIKQNKQSKPKLNRINTFKDLRIENQYANQTDEVYHF